MHYNVGVAKLSAHIRRTKATIRDNNTRKKTAAEQLSGCSIQLCEIASVFVYSASTYSAIVRACIVHSCNVQSCNFGHPIFSRLYLSVSYALRISFTFLLQSFISWWLLTTSTGNLIRRNPSDYNPRLIVVVRSVFNESWRSLLSASAWFLYFLFNALSPASVKGHSPIDVKRNQTHETEPPRPKFWSRDRGQNCGIETETTWPNPL